MNVAVGGKGPHPRDRGGESAERSGDIDGANQPGNDVAGVVAIEGRPRFGTFVEFVELPFGGIAIEMRHALADNLSASRGQKKFQAFDMRTTGKLLALAIHPENGEGERSIDRGLGLLCVDAEYCKC